MFLSDDEEKELLDYAITKGCGVIMNNYVINYRNKIADGILRQTDEKSWIISINEHVILERIPYKKNYYRSSVLEPNVIQYRFYIGHNIVVKYNCGVKLENMKKYIDTQIERLPKIKKKLINERLKNMEKDFE